MERSHWIQGKISMMSLEVEKGYEWCRGNISMTSGKILIMSMTPINDLNAFEEWPQWRRGRISMFSITSSDDLNDIEEGFPLSQWRRRRISMMLITLGKDLNYIKSGSQCRQVKEVLVTAWSQNLWPLRGWGKQLFSKQLSPEPMQGRLADQNLIQSV